MTDIVERLRKHAHRVRGISYNGIPGQVIPEGGVLASEAATLIEKQRAQLSLISKALIEACDDIVSSTDHYRSNAECSGAEAIEYYAEALTAARTLEETTP